jgi:hypothetical protein
VTATLIKSNTFSNGQRDAGAGGRDKVASRGVSSGIWALIGVLLALLLFGLAFFLVWKRRRHQTDDGDEFSEGTELSFETEREDGATTFGDEFSTDGLEFADQNDDQFIFLDGGDIFEGGDSIEEGLFRF